LWLIYGGYWFANIQEKGKTMPILKFVEQHVSDERFESCGVFDVNNDGILDIVSGAYWYPGPKFDRKHKIGDLQPIGEYFDDFSDLPMDVDGDGYMDYITGGWWGNTLRWRQNPKGDPTKPWAEHVIAETGNVETTRLWDIDGDGELEIVPNTPGTAQRYYKLLRDAAGKGTGQFKTVTIYDPGEGKGTDHGLGFGDINGDGRGDIVLRHGWLEAPEDRENGQWIFHPEFDLGSASVPIIVADVNGDGLNDLIVGCAHGYGLWWYEQKMTGGKRSWVKHPIDPFNATYHDMWWVDIDNDGEMELVTGKRYRAHCGHDAGDYDPYGIYYFKWNGESFTKMPIVFGEIRKTKGCGIAFQVVDLDGDGWLDIVAPGKDGLSIFWNKGFMENMGD